jgi:hypothetical protein
VVISTRTNKRLAKKKQWKNLGDKITVQGLAKLQHIPVDQNATFVHTCVQNCVYDLKRPKKVLISHVPT